MLPAQIIVASLMILFSLSFSRSSAYIVQNTGCYHNGTWYADKSLVPTMEKCLNCECKLKTLVCRLKVCPEIPMPPPRGCVVVEKQNSCCAYLSCARLEAYQRLPSIRRIISYLDNFERESIDRVVNENMLQRRSDDSDVDTYVCVKNGTVYKSGSAMSSSNLCSYCYCIGGTEKCVKPKCMLPVEGCKPIFVDSNCCPVRYDCSLKTSGKSSQEVNYRKTNNKHFLRMSQRLQRNRGCTIGKQYYAEGQKMKPDANKPCDICFCIRGARHCAPKKCAPALKNCLPVVPKGQCCPSSYDCDTQRYYRRSENSRQFNLLSLFFNEADKNMNSTIAIEYPHDRNPEIISPQTKIIDADSSGTSFLDKLRQGLEIIDTNNAPMLDDLPNKMQLETTTRKDELSLFDLLLESDTKIDDDEDVLESTTNSSNLSSWIDYWLGPDENNEETLATTTIQTVVGKNATEFYTTINPIDDDDDSEISTEDLLQTTENTDAISTTDYFNTIKTLNELTENSFSDEMSTNTAVIKHPTTTYATTTDSEYKSTINVLYKNNNSTVEEAEMSTEKIIDKDKITVIAPVKFINQTKQNDTTTSTTTTTTNATNITTSQSAEQITNVDKTNSLLNAFMDGISVMFSSDKSKLNRTDVQNITNSNLSTTTTAKPLPLFKPIPTVKTHVRINSKIANLTSSNANRFVQAKPIQNLSAFINKTKTTTTTTTENNNQINKLNVPITVKPIDIKTILEEEAFEHSVEPTLPPSLPNLKIIPFLPTDAVQAERTNPSYESYYNNKSPIDKIDYDIYDEDNAYPSLTERFPNYGTVDDGSKAEYIYKFNIEGPPVSTIMGTAGVKIKGFSPPTKTEGGFLPKKPLVIMENQLNSEHMHEYQPLNYFVDMTTADINLSTTKLIEITTPDPFKDVIRTETPPDLAQLIRQKEMFAVPQNTTDAAETKNETALHTYKQVLHKNVISKHRNNTNNNHTSLKTTTIPPFKHLPKTVTTFKPAELSAIKKSTTQAFYENTLLNSTKPEKITTASTPVFQSPFDKLPFMNSSFEIKSMSKPTSTYKPHLENKLELETHKMLQNKTTNNIGEATTEATRQLIAAQTSTSLFDPFGAFKLAGCNIYGRMYRVDRIIVELSSKCRECKCTQTGVECKNLDC